MCSSDLGTSRRLAYLILASVPGHVYVNCELLRFHVKLKRRSPSLKFGVGFMLPPAKERPSTRSDSNNKMREVINFMKRAAEG